MKRFSGLVLALSLAACEGSPEYEYESSIEALTITDGLMAQFTFDKGNANDSSGRGHNGTAVGNPIYAAEHGGKALLLSSNSQYVTVPHHADLAPATTLTACAWVKPEVLTWPNRILEKGAGDAYWMYLVDAKVVVGASLSSGVHEQESTGVLYVHEWNHVCSTFDGNTASVYINGALDSTFAASGTFTSYNEPLTLGWKYNAGDIDHLRGYLDDVRIYNRALSASEVASVYAVGKVAKPVELSVACTVPGDIYLNGHATGKTCPATLSLPVAGNYFVGIGSASKGYQHQQITTDGTSPVAVSFTDSNWLGARTWKILIYNVRNATYDNGKKGKLLDSTISTGLASANATATTWVTPYSRKLLQWQITSLTDETTVGKVVIDEHGFPYLDPDATLAAAGRTTLASQYDQIFFLYPAAKATDGTSYGACCGASTGGYKTQLPDTWGVFGGWGEGTSGNSQIWLHEWLHSVEWNSGAIMGWPVGINGLHGSTDHGYSSSASEAWLPWYRAWMTGLVLENGKYVGIPPMAYLEEQALSSSLIARQTVSAAGKVGSISASAGTGKVTLTWSASSGGPVGYSVKRGTSSSGPFTRIAANLTSTSYADTAVSKGTKYYYVVVSTSRGGESANSAVVNATPK